MECPKCGNESGPSHLFCSACGEQLQAQPPDPTPGPYPGAYPSPPYYQAPVVVVQKTEGIFVAAMILGITSILMWYAGFILGTLAIIFYYKGKARLKADPTLGGSGMGMAGLVTGIVGVSLSCIIWTIIIIAASVGPH
jgi:hypothetical protein